MINETSPKKSWENFMQYKLMIAFACNAESFAVAFLVFVFVFFSFLFAFLDELAK